MDGTGNRDRTLEIAGDRVPTKSTTGCSVPVPELDVAAQSTLSSLDAWGTDTALYLTRPKTKSASGYTYVVSAGAMGLKIGHSCRPLGRLSEMQVGSPVKMWLAHTWRLSPEGSKVLERQLHAAFAFAAMHGEWFRAEAREVIAAGDLFTAGRAEDARELIGLIQSRRELEDRLDRASRAWYYAAGKPKERADAEKAGKLLVPSIERDLARNDLASMELGLRRLNHAEDTRWGKVELERLHERAALTAP